MSKSHAVGKSLCHSEDSEEGDLPGWTWWGWRPGDGKAQLEEREPGLSTQNMSRHTYVHVHMITHR